MTIVVRSWSISLPKHMFTAIQLTSRPKIDLFSYRNELSMIQAKTFTGTDEDPELSKTRNANIYLPPLHCNYNPSKDCRALPRNTRGACCWLVRVCLELRVLLLHCNFNPLQGLATAKGAQHLFNSDCFYLIPYAQFQHLP